MLLITFSTTTLVTSWVIYSHLLRLLPFNVYRLFSSAYILNQKILREFIRGAGGGRTLFITWALTWCDRTTATTMAVTIIDDFLKLTILLVDGYWLPYWLPLSSTIKVIDILSSQGSGRPIIPSNVLGVTMCNPQRKCTELISQAEI